MWRSVAVCIPPASLLTVGGLEKRISDTFLTHAWQLWNSADGRVISRKHVTIYFNTSHRGCRGASNTLPLWRSWMWKQAHAHKTRSSQLLPYRGRAALWERWAGLSCLSCRPGPGPPFLSGWCRNQPPRTPLPYFQKPPTAAEHPCDGLEMRKQTQKKECYVSTRWHERAHEGVKADSDGGNMLLMMSGWRDFVVWLI